jgi:hypothetical protein
MCRASGAVDAPRQGPPGTLKVLSQNPASYTKHVTCLFQWEEAKPSFVLLEFLKMLLILLKGIRMKFMDLVIRKI